MFSRNLDIHKCGNDSDERHKKTLKIRSGGGVVTALSLSGAAVSPLGQWGKLSEDTFGN